MTTVGAAELPDFKPAPNQGGNTELYEAENRALDPDGHVLAAMRARAPWAGRTLLDLGCGSGYWLGSVPSWSVAALWGSWSQLAAEPSRRVAQRWGFFRVLIPPRPTPGWTSSFQRASVKPAMPLSFVLQPL